MGHGRADRKRRLSAVKLAVRLLGGLPIRLFVFLVSTSPNNESELRLGLLGLPPRENLLLVNACDIGHIVGLFQSD